MNNIKAGDLVRIAYACCPRTDQNIGIIFIVHEVKPSRLSNAKCRFCGKPSPTPFYARRANSHPLKGFGLWRLKKIPPLEELEDAKHEEEITA